MREAIIGSTQFSYRKQKVFVQITYNWMGSPLQFVEMYIRSPDTPITSKGTYSSHFFRDLTGCALKDARELKAFLHWRWFGPRDVDYRY